MRTKHSFFSNVPVGRCSGEEDVEQFDLGFKVDHFYASFSFGWAHAAEERREAIAGKIKCGLRSGYARCWRNRSCYIDLKENCV